MKGLHRSMTVPIILYIVGAASLPAVKAEDVASTEQVCNSVQGLCSLPITLVSWPGTHNSFSWDMSLNLIPLGDSLDIEEWVGNYWESQSSGFAMQLAAGVRAFDLDVAYKVMRQEDVKDWEEGSAYISRAPQDGYLCVPVWAHCTNDQLCSYPKSTAAEDNFLVASLNLFAKFLEDNPNDALQISWSNLHKGALGAGCPSTATLRNATLAALGLSNLIDYAATTAVTGDELLGDLIRQGQRAFFLFYDEFAGPSSYTTTTKNETQVTVVNQKFFRVIASANSEGVNKDDNLREEMLDDIVERLPSAGGNDTAATPFRVVGYFPNICVAYCNVPQTQQIKDIFVAAGVDLKQHGEDVGSAVVDTGKNVADSAVDGAKDVKDKADEVGDTVKDKVDDVKQSANDVKEAAQDDRIQDLPEAVVGVVQSAVDVPKSAIVDGAKKVGGAVMNTTKNIIEDVKEGGEKAIDKVKDMAGTVGDAVTNAADKVGDFFGDLFGRRKLLDTKQDDKDITCNYQACAIPVNSASHLLYMVYKSTVPYGTTTIVPRFNVFQLNYYDLPEGEPGIFNTTDTLNTAWVQQTNSKTGTFNSLSTCAWLADTEKLQAQLVCLYQKTVPVDLSKVREALIPPGLALYSEYDKWTYGPICGGDTGVLVDATMRGRMHYGEVQRAYVKQTADC